MMLRRKPQQTPKPASLPQPQADFTAEGAPPPAQGAAAGAVTSKKAGSLPPAPKARKGPPATKSRWQR